MNKTLSIHLLTTKSAWICSKNLPLPPKLTWISSILCFEMITKYSQENRNHLKGHIMQLFSHI